MKPCDRCDRGGEAVARVTSEILNIAVCALCANEAVSFTGSRPDELCIAELKEEQAAVA